MPDCLIGYLVLWMCLLFILLIPWIISGWPFTISSTSIPPVKLELCIGAGSLHLLRRAAVAATIAIASIPWTSHWAFSDPWLSSSWWGPEPWSFMLIRSFLTIFALEFQGYRVRTGGGINSGGRRTRARSDASVRCSLNVKIVIIKPFVQACFVDLRLHCMCHRQYRIRK